MILDTSCCTLYAPVIVCSNNLSKKLNYPNLDAPVGQLVTLAWRHKGLLKPTN
jgi:hypothetical protein